MYYIREITWPRIEIRMQRQSELGATHTYQSQNIPIFFNCILFLWMCSVLSLSLYIERIRGQWKLSKAGVVPAAPWWGGGVFSGRFGGGVCQQAVESLRSVQRHDLDLEQTRQTLENHTPNVSARQHRSVPAQLRADIRLLISLK